MDEESPLSSTCLCPSVDSSFDSHEIDDPRSSRRKGSTFQSMLSCNVASVRQSAQLLFAVAGVYATYICYGVFQEQLFRYRSVDGKAFRYVWSLQVLESITTFWFGLAGRYLFGCDHDLPVKGIMFSGVSQVFAKVFCSMSLAAGMSFPVMTLAKSSKIVPVMLGQFLLGGSLYGVRDYLFAGLLVMGTVLLSLGTSKNLGESDASCSRMGMVYVLISLCMDGCTGGLQKQLKRDTVGTPPTTYDLLVYTHGSMLAIALLISMVSNDLWEGIVYIQLDPGVAVLVARLCALSVIGQFFIFYVIVNFDSMVCVTITTTRKMWSTLLSIAMFQHQLTSTGYIGLTLALAGLIIEIQGKVLVGHYGHQQTRKSQDQNKKPDGIL